MQSVDVFIKHEWCEHTVLSSANFSETFVSRHHGGVSVIVGKKFQWCEWIRSNNDVWEGIPGTVKFRTWVHKPVRLYEHILTNLYFPPSWFWSYIVLDNFKCVSSVLERGVLCVFRTPVCNYPSPLVSVVEDKRSLRDLSVFRQSSSFSLSARICLPSTDWRSQLEWGEFENFCCLC